ncbi:hypothetical protein ACHAQJ_004255 [Trichoderma viride]
MKLGHSRGTALVPPRIINASELVLQLKISLAAGTVYTKRHCAFFCVEEPPVLSQHASATFAALAMNNWIRKRAEDTFAGRAKTWPTSHSRLLCKLIANGLNKNTPAMLLTVDDEFIDDIHEQIWRL